MKQEINQIKDRLVNKLFLLALLNMGFALIFSLARWFEIGFHPTYILQSLLYILLVFISLLRKHLSVNFKSHFLAIIYLVVGIVGLYLVAHYSAFFLVLISVSLATILLGRKTAFYYAIMFLAIYIPIGWLHITNRITIQLDLNSYAQLLTIWASWFASLLTLFIILIEGFGLFYNELVNSVNLQIAATDELNKSETFRRQVFESSRLPIVVMDANTYRYIDCNPAAIEIYGYTSKEQVLGLTPPDVSTPIQYDETPSAEKAKLYIEKAKTEGSVVFEWKHQRPDGVIWDAEVHLLSFSAGDKPLLQFTLLDITERKLTERALEESHRLLKSTFASMKDAVFIIDSKTLAITHCNYAAVEIFGYNQEEMLGKSTEFLHINKDALVEFRNHLSTGIAEKGYLFLPEFKMKHKDGTIFPTEHTVTPIEDEQCMQIGWVSVVRDITERKLTVQALKESEERYKLLINNIMYPVIVTSFDGKMLYINQKTADFLGIEPSEIRNLKSPNFWVDPTKRDEYIAELKTNSVVRNKEVRFCNKKNEMITVVMSSNIIDYYGQKAIFSIYNDITQRKQAEVELQQSEARLSALLSSMKDIIFEIDLNGCFEGYYAQDIKGLYVPPDLFIGKKIDEVLPPNVTKLLSEAIEDIHEGESYRQFDYSLTIENNIQYESAIVTPRYNTLNEIIGITVVCRDITERKLIEEAMHNSERKVRAILDQSFVFIGLMSLDGILLDANRASLKLARVTPNEVFNKPFWEGPWWNHSAELQNKLRESIKLAAAGEEVRFEASHPATDGSLRYVDFSLRPVKNEQGDIIYLIPEGHDITERKKAEEEIKFQNIILKTNQELSLDGILIDDDEGNILSTNKRFQEIWEIPQEIIDSKSNEIIVNSVLHLFSDPDAFLEKIEYLKRVKTEKSFDEIQLKNGKIIEQYSVPMLSELGEYYGRIWFFRDITERKRYQQELESGNRILSLIAEGNELPETLNALCQFTEEMDSNIRSSVLLFDPNRQILVQGAAPSLPADYNALMEAGLPIGPNVGCCGTAAYTGKLAVAADIQNDPHWIPYTAFIEKTCEHNLNACWSMPIISSSGKVLGAFANYNQKIGGPSTENLRVLEWATQVAAMAIERKQVEAEKAKSASLQSATIESTADGLLVINTDGIRTLCNQRFMDMWHIPKDVEYEADEVMVQYVVDQMINREEFQAKIRELYNSPETSSVDLLYLLDGRVFERHSQPQRLEEKIIGRVWSFRDITERKVAEDITKARLSLIQYAQDHSLEELLQKTLDELEVLTHSLIGFYHLVSDDGNSIELKAWSSRTSREFCNIKGLAGHQYPVHQAGVWADSLREKRPVIHNDYKSLTNRKGLPDGHAEVIRELAVPVIRGNKVVALLGVGNKPTEYTPKDVELVSNFAEFTWEIVANKLVEEEIRRFKTIADHAVYGKAIATPEGKLVYVNKHFANIHGYKPEELVGLHLSSLHSQRQLEKVEETISNMIQQGHFESREIWHIHKDGKEFPMLMNGIVLRDANGNPEYLATSAVDISVRKKMEDQLRKLSQAVEQSPVSVVITNPDGNIEYVNPKFTEVTGYNLNEAKGQNPRVLKSGEQTAAYYKELWQTISSGKEWQGEFHNKKKNGELYWESASISPIINSEGAVTHYLAIKKDITEQKKLESELRVLSNAIEQNPASIVITNINGDIEYVNPKFTQITGYTLNEVKGKNPRILKTGIITPEQYSNLWATISRGKIWQGEFCNKKKDGTKFWEFALISPVLDTFGKITHYVAVKEDITEKKEIERKIISAVIEGEERERNRFSRDLHDGIGPLLSSIKLYFQWLSETDDPKKRKFIIENGDKNLNQALDSIREISNNLSPRTLNNLGVIAALKNFIENINRTRKLNIEFNSNTKNRFEEKVEIIVYRIITELINNTLKYASAEKSEVELFFNDESGLLLLTYSDNGKGFDLAKVKAQPKGIGLTNIEQRVNSLNGKINIKSSKGKGVQVSIELPLQKN